MNIGLREETDAKFPGVSKSSDNDKYLIYESNVFRFPFT